MKKFLQICVEVKSNMCRGKILYCIAMLKRHQNLFSQRSKLSNNKGYLGEKGKIPERFLLYDQNRVNTKVS